MVYQVGDTIGEYKITGTLGSGSFGIVYLVEWRGKGGSTRRGALKILKDPKFKDILEEVSAWARVSHHPNILTFIGATEYEKEIILISEYATKGSLVDWIKAYAGKKEFIEEAVALILGVMRGLEHLHKNDIVHRDIKPANILLETDAPLLADFGLARGLNLVQSSVLAGTVPYMSPELINSFQNHGLGTRKYERTEADDLWAAAITFYQMLAGDIPFKSADEIKNSDPSPLPTHIPKELSNVVDKALRKDISLRFPTATAMREAIEKALDEYKQRVQKETIESINRQEKNRQNLGVRRDIWRETPYAVEYSNYALDVCEKGDHDGAIHYCNIAIGMDPLWSDAWKNRGTAFYAKGNYDQAVEDYNKAIELDPENADAYYKRAIIYLNELNYSQAIKDYDKAIELDSDVVELNHDSFIQYYSKAIEENPQNAVAYTTRGDAYLNRGEHNLAIEDYSGAIVLNPQDASAYYKRGNAYFKKGVYDRAIKDFNKAIEINPQDAPAYNGRGLAYYHKGEYDQTIEDCSASILFNPQYAIAYANRGNAYLSKGDYEEALRDLDKAIELNPQYADAYNSRANAYYDNHQYDLAIRDYGKAIELNPKDAVAYNNRGTAYANIGEDHKAIEDYYKAIKLNPQFTVAHFNRGVSLMNKGQDYQALKDFNKAIELDPQYALAYQQRGIVSEKLGDFAGATADRKIYSELSGNK